MIVDTSAVLAIAFGEPDSDRFLRALAGAGKKRMSAATLFEATMVAFSQTDIEPALRD